MWRSSEEKEKKNMISPTQRSKTVNLQSKITIYNRKHTLTHRVRSYVPTTTSDELAMAVEKANFVT